jgi:heat shock protein HtpX
MSMKAAFAASLAGVLYLAAPPIASAQLFSARAVRADVWVQVRMETSGEASINVWPRDKVSELGPAVAEALHCPGSVKPDPYQPTEFRCPNALRRDGLALEGVVDLAPILRELSPSDKVQLWIYYPRLGSHSSSMSMEEQGRGTNISQTVQFEAGAAPPPIQVRFGFRRGQLMDIFLPLVALVLVLTLIAVILSVAGLAGLSRSIILLGTILWMALASQLKVGALIHILLFGTPWANLAALFLEFWPSLLCVAAGVALGSGKDAPRKPMEMFWEILGGLAVIPLVVTCVIGALPPMMQEDWIATLPWLAAAPVFVLGRRQWLRRKTGASLRLVTGGELKERVSALAARVGRPQIKVYISSSPRSQVSAAFTLPGKSIYLTAPLLRLLNKSEVDAVAAHELSHFSNPGRGLWIALCLAMILFELPGMDGLFPGPAGAWIALLIPLTVFFAALHVSRKREFAADANAAALTGNPRAMISSLARIVRNNKSPLDMNAAVECFSSHPSTRKRIWALAAVARLGPADVETLCAGGDPGDHYALPPEETAASGPIFTPEWQKANSGLYGWSVLLGASGAGLSIAGLLDRFAGPGAARLLGGMALGYVLTKCFSAAVISGNYARLRRKLVAKLGVSGQLVGFAIDSEPRLYGGRRFSDAGLLRFENGRLCYRSERTSLELNPADVVEVGMVAASPANWLRRTPMVRFRLPESGEQHAFILHPVSWLATQRRLLRSIERWRATQASAEATSITGFNRIAGEPCPRVPISAVARAFRISGGVTLLAALTAVPLLQADWWFVGYALAITAFAHIFIFVPSLLYMPPAPSPEPAPPVHAD